jgi:hypothetical protein
MVLLIFLFIVSFNVFLSPLSSFSNNETQTHTAHKENKSNCIFLSGFVVVVLLFPVMRTWRKLTRMSDSGACKAFVCSRRGVDAKGNPIGINLV